MSGYKEAITRINTLDRCLSNFAKKYYITNLVEECNRRLSEEYPDTNGVKRRQVYYDIELMKAEYGAPIESYRDGRKTYIRYSDPEFRIHKTPLTNEELNNLQSALAIIERMQGAPNLEWLDSLSAKLKTVENDRNQQIIALDENLDYSGSKHIMPLFRAITNNRSIKVEYQSFRSDQATVSIVSPYHIKQYNKRWFLFCKHKDYNTITNYALDRIINFEEVEDKYERSTIQWEEYFDDVIGVTIPQDTEVERIEFMVKSHRAKYLMTKPIHLSQTTLKADNQDMDGYTKFRINVMPNRELKSVLLSFGSDLVVLSPASLANELLLEFEGSRKQLKFYVQG